MSTPTEPTAAMSAPAEPEAAVRAQRRQVSPNVVMSVLGGLLTALLIWQFNSLGNSIDSLGTRIDQQGAELGARIDQQGAELGARIDQQGAELGARIDQQGAELRAEIAGLTAEMQTGFGQIHEILLDHTERLTRLETKADQTDARLARLETGTGR